MRQIPNKYRPTLSREDTIERWKTLANGGPKVIKESVTTPNNRATLMFKVRGADGITYGILQENTSFFLKASKASLHEAKASDFDYINGAQNILSEKFSSASAAHRRLNAKLHMLRESIGDVNPDEQPQGGEEGDEQEDSLLNKLHQKDSEAEEAEQTPAVGGAEGGEPDLNAGPNADPLAGLGDENGGGMGADSLGPEGGDNAPAPEGDSNADPLAGLGDDNGAGGEEAPNPEGEESNPEGEQGQEGGDASNEAQKTLGKLGQQLDGIGELSPEFAKSVLNTIITKVKRALGTMSDDDKEKIQQRISKDGAQLDEEEEVFDEGYRMTSDDWAKQNSRDAARHASPSTDRGRVASNLNQVGAARRGDDIDRAPTSTYNKERGQAAMQRVAISKDNRQRAGVDIGASLKEDDMLPESDWDAYRDHQEQNHQSALERQKPEDNSIDFATFMDKNGYEGDNDDTTVKGIEAWASRLSDYRKQPTGEDIQALIGYMNPYVWGEIHQGGVPEQILNQIAKAANVDPNGEWTVGGGQSQQPMNETWSAVSALTRLLVAAEIKNG